MNLHHDELQELNNLLAKEAVNLPAFRREVSSTGSNYHWLQKHILKKNNNISDRLKKLLNIK